MGNESIAGIDTDLFLRWIGLNKKEFFGHGFKPNVVYEKTRH